jgi:ABC-2 type transport system ATP-binding protein
MQASHSPAHMTLTHPPSEPKIDPALKSDASCDVRWSRRRRPTSDGGSCDTDVVLAVSRLVKRYGDTRALDGVDLCLGPGEVLGLLGPNGAGKSTLVSIIAGLRSADSGFVSIGGVSVAADPRGARRITGVAPQASGVYPNVSVANNLKFFGRLAGVRRCDLRQRITAVGEALDISHLLERLPCTLSGGEQRRVSTAIAILHRPRLLLLDEPTAGIDVHARRAVLQMVRNIAEQGTAVCYLTHYLPEVEALGASVGILEQGRMLAYGPLDTLIKAHGHSVIELAFLPNAGPATVSGQHVGPDGHVRVVAQDSKLTLQQVLSDLGAWVEQLQSVEVIQPSLNSVYLNLLGRHYERDRT